MAFPLKNSLISVVIRARNAAAELRRCLEGIKRQKLPMGVELELIVVDNESTDNTREIAHQNGAEIVFISAQDFSWGRALNRGIERAKGDFVILFSSDACPVDENWLAEMIRPFDDPQVAVVYGRQIPWPKAPVDEYVRIVNYFGQSSRHFDKCNCQPVPTGQGILVSNACAAIRRSIWESVHYDEEIRGGEEGVWTYKVLHLGHTSIYQATAKVYHSHHDPICRGAFRNWELYRKNLLLKQRSHGINTFSRYLGGYVKRRITNCMVSHAPIKAKLNGLLMLPWELAAFSFIAAGEALGIDRQKLRCFMWR